MSESCGNPAAETDALMARRTKFDRSRDCVKCKTNTGNIVIRHAVYCKECFTPLQITKLKRALEPSINAASAAAKGPSRNKLRADGNLAIGISGGLGSTVLFDLIARCYYSTDDSTKAKAKGGTKHPRNNETIWREARVFYIEMCGAYPESASRDRTDEIRLIVEKYPAFEFCPLRIEDAFDPAWWARVGGRSPEKEEAMGVNLASEDLLLGSVSLPTGSPGTALRAYLSSLPTATATQSAIANLTRLLLLYTAASTGSSHLLLGTTLTSLSIGLISGVAVGGGFVVREEAGEQWAPRGGASASAVKMVRPLKDMGMKECAAWAWWHGLAVVGKESVSGGRQGIGGLTKDFIVGLERDYPSTVSTIARTCAKLAPKAAASERCVLCERPAQKGVQEWKARISIRSVRDANTNTDASHAAPPPNPNPKPPHDGQDQPPPTLALTPHLCYACHTTFTSRSSRSAAHLAKGVALRAQGGPVPLPAWVASRMHEFGPGGDSAGHAGGDREVWQGTQMGVGEMQAVVGEFLLEE